MISKLNATCSGYQMVNHERKYLKMIFFKALWN